MLSMGSSATPAIGPMAERPKRMTRHLASYGLLGLSSCVVLVEPSPFDLLALVLMTASVVRSRTGPLHRRLDAMTANTVCLLLLFVLLQFVPAVLGAQDTADAVFYATVTTFLVLTGIHLASLYSEGDPRFGAFTAGYAAGAILSAAIAIASTHPRFAALAPDALLFAGRPKALFKDPNVLGPYITPAVLVFVTLAADRRNVGRLLYSLASLVCIVGVVVTASRAAWINLAVTLIVFLVFAGRKYKALMLVLALATALGTALLVSTLLEDEAVKSAVALWDARMQLQDYDADRFSSAEDAFAYGLANPAGAGPGQIATATGHIPPIDPHNTYLRIFAENGATGLAVFALVVVIIALRASTGWSRRCAADPWFLGIHASLAGQLVNAAVVDALHWRHFWVLVALAIYAAGRPLGLAYPARGGFVR